MAIIKVVGNGANLDENLNNGTSFKGSDTIFTFGTFGLQSNFSGRIPVDYKNELSSFVRPITLETLSITQGQSVQIYDATVNAVLNLNKSDLRTYVRFGSTHELFRVSLQNIIIAYPASLFVNPQSVVGGNYTYFNYNYDEITDTCYFEIPAQYIDNNFGLVYNQGNKAKPDDVELKNLNLSFDKYVVWSTKNPTDNTHTIIGFTGNSTGNNVLRIIATGDAFDFMSGITAGKINIHLKPNPQVFEEFRTLLTNFEQYFVAERVDTEGFRIMFKKPTLLEDGGIIYNDTVLIWSTSDGYNVDFNTPIYNAFQNTLFGIGDSYDSVKTDLIARFLTPASLKVYDLTEEGKMTKLLRIYGREFDDLRQFIDGLVYVNTTTYDKKNNLPDQIVKNLARTFGWDVFTLVNEAQFVDSILTLQEANDSNRLVPSEVDIELWRRILINTNFYWKSKGTRDAIKSMFLLIGIPEPFINITEYIYTVDGKIDPRNVPINLGDLPSTIYTTRGELIKNSLPFDDYGYPNAPLQSPKFYFQISGDTDSGQAYMDNFRLVGFNLNRTVDNKKSWIEDGHVNRNHYSTPQYHQEDSKLVLNTKEVDIALDTARGIEYDVYSYIKDIDFPANSSGYTLPYTYVNISAGYSGATNTFTIPNIPVGNVEVYYNGVQLTTKDTFFSGVTGTSALYDYSLIYNGGISKWQVVLNGFNADKTNGDIIEITYLYKVAGAVVVGSVKYLVTQVKPNMAGTLVSIPEIPSGDVQLSINGVLMTKSTPTFLDGDYIVDPNNTKQLVIQNPAITAFFVTNPILQVAYIVVSGNIPITGRMEVKRVDSFCSSKLYYDRYANRYVYKLNYKVVNVENVKVMLNGIALTPNLDFTVNPSNPYEIYLPSGINLGDIITAFYAVGGNDLFNPIIEDFYGLGDISNLSFLEFIELIQRRLINAKTRKIISDFKGGFYPALLSVYVRYLKRSTLPVDDPLHTNGYTFQNLYPFLNKYNAFFTRFVNELLSATIIMRKGGLLIRNTVFTKQKFMYRRGVSFDPYIPFRGDNGTLYQKRLTSQSSFWTDDIVCQNVGCETFEVTNVIIEFPTTTTTTTTKPLPSVSTKVGGVTDSAINNTGGQNIVRYAEVYQYGMEYRKWNGFNWEAWNIVPNTPFPLLTVNNFTQNITGLLPSTRYQYRAYIIVGSNKYYGLELEATTLASSFSTVVSLQQDSVVTIGDTKVLNYRLKFTPALPAGKIATINLRYVSLLVNDIGESHPVYTNEITATITKNVTLLETYNVGTPPNQYNSGVLTHNTPAITVGNADTITGNVQSEITIDGTGSADNSITISLLSATINFGSITMGAGTLTMSHSEST